MCAAQRPRGRPAGFGGANGGPVSRVLQTETDRVEAFSDGVLAIAITLLVLDLRPAEHGLGQLVAGLVRQWSAYLGYVTSFLYLVVILAQPPSDLRSDSHRRPGPALRQHRGVVHRGVAAVSHGGACRCRPGGQPGRCRRGVALYVAIAALMCASWWWLFRYLYRHRDLVHSEQVPYFPQGRMRAAVGVVGYTIGGALGYLATPDHRMGVCFCSCRSSTRALPRVCSASADAGPGPSSAK